MLTDLVQWLPIILGLVAAGLFAGFVGGLFGVGGGTTIVPVLFVLFEAINPTGQHNLHVAVGTSLTIIIATTSRSLLAHHKRGAVDFTILRAWIPWVMVGAVLGALLAKVTPQTGLGVIYGAFSLLVAALLGLLPEGTTIRKSTPTGAAKTGLATFIGGASAMMGVGGGAFGATTLSLTGTPIHRAVGTATGFGTATAVPAAILYMVANLDVADAPPFSLGAVNVPAVLLLAIFTTTAAPWGARVAHALPRKRLRKLFALYMVLTATVVFLKAWL